MSESFNFVLRFLEQDEWPTRVMDGGYIVQTGFSGKSGTSWTCYAQVRDDLQQFLFYSVLPTRIPEPKRPILAEFVARANFGMRIGNFELDFNDGELRFKTSFDYEGVNLHETMLRNAIYANVMTMDHYLPGIMRLLYTDVTPAAVIEEIEAEQG